MKKYQLLWILLVCMFWMPSVAQEAVDGTQLKVLAERFAQVQTIESQFVQENHMALLTDPVRSKGKFYFQKNPSNLHWQYTEPFENGMVFQDGKVFRLTSNGKTPVKGTVARTVIAQMMTWLTMDVEHLSKHYRIVRQKDCLLFIPRQQQMGDSVKILLWLKEEGELPSIEKLELQEPTGDKTVLTFMHTRLNKPLPQGVF